MRDDQNIQRQPNKHNIARPRAEAHATERTTCVLVMLLLADNDRRFTNKTSQASHNPLTHALTRPLSHHNSHKKFNTMHQQTNQCSNIRKYPCKIKSKPTQIQNSNNTRQIITREKTNVPPQPSATWMAQPGKKQRSVHKQQAHGKTKSHANIELTMARNSSSNRINKKEPPMQTNASEASRLQNIDMHTLNDNTQITKTSQNMQYELLLLLILLLLLLLLHWTVTSTAATAAATAMQMPPPPPSYHHHRCCPCSWGHCHCCHCCVF